MNYRHAFHAGNFADLVKHAALIALLDLMLKRPGPLTVVDTHAGAGLYDLDGPEAKRSGEAAAGIARLLAASDAPASLQALSEAVRRTRSATGHASLYPGSPWLTAERLRPDDRLIACELEPQAHAALQAALKGRRQAQARRADGYAEVVDLTPSKGPALVLIDPPFERADDYQRCVQTAQALLQRNRGTMILIWLPLKDLETFDAFLRSLEDAVGRTPLAVAECRIRPLNDPMRMNGCALVLLNSPVDLDSQLSAVCAWTAGGAGGAGRVWRP